jgi:hypothetical protein
MRKISFVLISLLMGALTANADTLVTIRPTGIDSVDWSQLGTSVTNIYSPFTFTTTLGVSGIGNNTNADGADWVMQQGVSALGNFAPGDYFILGQGIGSLTLTFDQGYTQIGAQIQAEYFGAFTAQICDINACFTENGVSNNDNDNSAIYIGIDGADITSVTFSLTNAHLDPTSILINDVTLDGNASVTPEPGSLLLFGTGLAALAGALRRRYARKGV